MSRKGLLAVVSCKYRLMKNVSVIHFSIFHFGENLMRHPHSGHLSTSVLGSGELLGWCQSVFWLCSDVSVARVLTAVLANTFREVAAFITSKTEDIAEVSMFSLNLSKQALTVRFKQLGSMVKSIIRMIIAPAAPSDNFWQQTSVQTSTSLETYLHSLFLSFPNSGSVKLRPFPT